MQFSETPQTSSEEIKMNKEHVKLFALQNGGLVRHVLSKQTVQITGYVASHKLVETSKDTRKGYKRVTPQLLKLWTRPGVFS